MSLRKRPQQPQARSRLPVRVGAFEQTLANFNKEQSVKVARFVAAYHVGQIEPRLRWLEMWWWEKLWDYLKRLWAWLRRGATAKRLAKVREGCSHEKTHEILLGREFAAEGDPEQQFGIVCEDCRMVSKDGLKWFGEGESPEPEEAKPAAEVES